MERLCTWCNNLLPISDFYQRGVLKNGEPKYQSGCKKCNREYRKNHYTENTQAYIEKAKKRNTRITSELTLSINKLKDNPCSDCKIKFHPIAMDFDHVTGSKEFSISSMRCGGYNIERILEEIKKCELVCSNCHRIRTYKRLQTPVAQ